MADLEIGIPEFFAGRDVFITGASGTVGKPFLEKLLRSCPDVGKVYLLLREKKGKSVEERLQKIKDLKLLEGLREKNPDVLKKLIPMVGEVTEINLGLSKEDRKTLINDVSVVFHIAASVRFDDHLHFAILMNVRGTREVVSLALQMKKLEALVHVSTAYSNCNRKIVEEKLYPPLADWRTAIKIAETMDPNTIDIVTAKYLGEMPNTYVITKQMAEHVVNDMCKGRVRAVIVRVSIVVCTFEEPFPAWIDTMNGPAGLMIGVGLGLIKSLYADPKVMPDYIPLDICVKALLVCAWYESTCRNNNLDVNVYNCCGSKIYTTSYEDHVKIGIRHVQENGMERTLWYPCTIVTNCKYEHYLLILLFQVLPSLLLDAVLFIVIYKPMLYKIQRRIHTAMMKALAYFTLNEWTFVRDKFLALNQKIPQKDYKNFRLKLKAEDNGDFDMRRCTEIAYNARVNILPESSTPKQLRMRAILFKTAHYTVVGIVGLLLLWVFMSKTTKLINWMSHNDIF